MKKNFGIDKSVFNKKGLKEFKITVKEEDLPATWDWRKQKVVSPVKN